jgi:hypothetical protein
MPIRRRMSMSLGCALMLLLPAGARAQDAGARWYVSWGYNTESYSDTDLRFRQPALGNDFTLRGATLHDHRSWDFWNHAVTIPQYSIRVGRFIRRNTAIELNFDHAKAILASDQDVHVTGMLAGTPTDEVVPTGDFVQDYRLNNGANFFLLNLVQRFPLHGEPDHTGSVALLTKAGIGFMFPHTENTVLDGPNEPAFEFGGVGTGIEAALRVHAVHGFYVDGARKEFYGRYRGLNIDQGSASQDLWAHVTILSLGNAW